MPEEYFEEASMRIYRMREERDRRHGYMDGPTLEITYTVVRLGWRWCIQKNPGRGYVTTSRGDIKTWWLWSRAQRARQNLIHGRS